MNRDISESQLLDTAVVSCRICGGEYDADDPNAMQHDLCGCCFTAYHEGQSEYARLSSGIEGHRAVVASGALLADSWMAMRHLDMAAGTNDTLRSLLNKLAHAVNEARR